VTRARELAAMVNSTLKTDAVKLASDPEFQPVLLPTGVLPIDVLLGGGIPKGRITEMYGNFSSLKSYIALRCAAETQRAGGIAVLVDTEHAFDAEWARTLGVNTDDLIVWHPEHGEAAVDVTETFLRSYEVDLIVWDSVAATLPKTEHGKMASDTVQPARLAEFMSRSLRKLNTANHATALLFINQVRTNVGITFGSPEAVPGGKALPFYASHRISLRKTGKLYSDADPTTVRTSDGYKRQAVKSVVGQNIKATLEKSKLTAPHTEQHFTFDLEHAEVDEVGYAVGWALVNGVVLDAGRGTWEWPSVASGRGRKGLEATIRSDPKLKTKAIDQVWQSSCRGAPLPAKKSGSKRKPSS